MSWWEQFTMQLLMAFVPRWCRILTFSLCKIAKVPLDAHQWGKNKSIIDPYSPINFRISDKKEKKRNPNQ